MSGYAFDRSKHTEMFHTPWKLQLPAFRVFGNLYFVGNTDGASWLVDTDEGLVLFDTNYPHATAMLIDSIWSLGYDPRDIILPFFTPTVTLIISVLQSI